ncbi:MAG: DUF3302 domain-containing protein [Pseudomonadota bacterium]
MGSALQSLDVYDYLTFAALIVLAIAFFSVAMFVMGLPGSIAKRRNHPHAEAVNLMGWVGFLAVVPWIHALIWAYHDGVTVDIRDAGKDGPAAAPPAVDRQSLPRSEA